MYRNVSFKMDKIFPKYYIVYFGLCKFFNKGYLFSNDAVFSGHPVPGQILDPKTAALSASLGYIKDQEMEVPTKIG